MKKSYNKAFTLVELLAVIVILAIILVIAVPKIMDVINSPKKSTLETSVKMIASSAEKTKMQNTILGKEDATITCDSVAKLSSNDYESCTIEFDGNTAKVTVKGKGKFEGLSVCGGTKNEAIAQKEMCATPKEYFTYGLYALNSSDVTIEDADKCMRGLVYNFGRECDPSHFNEFCENNKVLYFASIDMYDELGMKLSDNAEIGVVITDYNLEGGTEVIIPDTIDGYPVIGVNFSDYYRHYLDLTKITIPDTILDEYTLYHDPIIYSKYISDVDNRYTLSRVGSLEVPEGCPPPS